MGSNRNFSQPGEITEATRRIAELPASNDLRGESGRAEPDPLALAVEIFRQGDRRGAWQLYEACHRRVYRLAVRMVGVQDAPDVTQQVFLQAFRSIGKFTGRSRFETWLYRLAVNESLQHLRRNRRRRHRTLDWEPTDEAHHADDADRKELLEQALARIDPELRSIFLLREVEGLSYREIAEALRIPEGTVGSRLNRARRDLQEQLADFRPGG